VTYIRHGNGARIQVTLDAVQSQEVSVIGFSLIPQDINFVTLLRSSVFKNEGSIIFVVDI
jgi:hypothetical protein